MRSPAREATLLHAPPRPPPPAPCDQARCSAWLPRGPWGALPPRWPRRPSRTTASPGARPARGPRQRLAGVGAAPGGLRGAAAWAPGSTRPRGPGPEGAQDQAAGIHRRFTSNCLRSCQAVLHGGRPVSQTPSHAGRALVSPHPPRLPRLRAGAGCAALTGASPGSGAPLRAFSVHTRRFISVYLRP